MKLYNELWIESEIDHEIAKRMAHDMGLFLPVTKYLTSRGIVTTESAKDYLYPELDLLEELMPLKNTLIAVEILIKAIQSNQHILVYGDYDVDGITSTVILVKYLEKLNARVDYFIPNRHEDGYGIHIDRLRERYDSFDLLITVDCGITAVEEVQELMDQGKTVIITDHHEPKEIIPRGIVIDPKCNPKDYQDYAGVGVAYQLIKELEKKTGIKAGIDALIFTAIGTIADLMPLSGVNRHIVKLGLSHMNLLENPGLLELIRVMKHEKSELKASDIGFKIAPAINATGRLGSALESMTLFMTDREDLIKELAENLKIINDERRDVEKKILDQAIKQVDQESDFIIVKGDDWNDGVVGIVASRLVEKFRKPAIVMTRKKDCYKGSGRSVGNFHLLKSLNATQDEIRQYGGHQFAAGLTVDLERFEAFKDKMNRYASIHLTELDRARKHYFYDSLSIEQINGQTVEKLSLLEPFGRGNPKPLFLFKGAKVSHMKSIGVNKDHLKMNLQMENRMIDAVGFNQAEKINHLSRGIQINLMGTLDKNVYLGIEYINIYFKDFRNIDFNFLRTQQDYAIYIQSLTSLVVNYHLGKSTRDYLSADYAIEEGIKANLFELSLDFEFAGPVDYRLLKDLEITRHRQWFENNLIKKLPLRSDLIKIYKKVTTKGEIPLKIFDESTQEFYNCNIDILSGKILSELGLMKYEMDGINFYLKKVIHDRSIKMDLMESQTFRNTTKIKEDWDEFKRQNP
jgi:single-stranded-DNA-specific exonuclease